MKNILFILLAITIVSCRHKDKTADLVIHNATIYTGEQKADLSLKKGQAMAITDGKVVEVGPEREILNRYIADEFIDAKLKFVYPMIYPMRNKSMLDTYFDLLTKDDEDISNEEALIRLTRIKSKKLVEDDLRGALIPGLEANFFITNADITKVSYENKDKVRIKAKYKLGKKF